MVTAHASVPSAVEAMRHGAFDYIEKPFDADQIERLVAQAIQHGRLLKQPAGENRAPRPEPPAMIGRSAPMQALRRRIAQIAATPGNHPHHRRKRHRQGTGGQGDPRRQRPRRRAAGQPQLPRALRPLDGKRTVRPRARGVHRGRRPAHRTLRNGRRRLDPPRRSDRDRPAPASEAAPRAARAVVRAGRLQRDAGGRRPRAGDDEPGPWRRGGGGPIPRGPLFPPRRAPLARAARSATAARTSPRWSNTSSSGAPARLQREPCTLDPSAQAPDDGISLAGQRPRVGKHRHARQRPPRRPPGRRRRAAPLADRSPGRVVRGRQAPARTA